MIKQPINLPEGFELEDFPVKDLARLAKLFRRGIAFEGNKVVVVDLKGEEYPVTVRTIIEDVEEWQLKAENKRRLKETDTEELPELDKSEGPGE